jgi:hypothetical protein
MAGSAIFARYLSGKPCGLLPPRLVWQLASAPLSGARGFRTGFGLMTPECLHPAFGLTLPLGLNPV